MRDFIRACQPYRGRIIGCGLGILAAIIWMLIGFWRTLLLLLLGFAGYVIGLAIDDREKLQAMISRIKLIFDRD